MQEDSQDNGCFVSRDKFSIRITVFLNHLHQEILTNQIQSLMSILTIYNILSLLVDLWVRHWLRMNLLMPISLVRFIKWFLDNKLSFLTLSNKIIHSTNQCCGWNKIKFKKVITHFLIFTIILVKESSKTLSLVVGTLMSMNKISNVKFLLII